ncbi:MAG: hypothetical protein HYR95_00220 [Candidatus Colwellbacteria bacterium]|nr:hypothetical protein [Candidatus Colwellbacteria bacterium]
MYFPDPEQFKGSSGYVIDGIWYPRVTSIIDIKAKPALYRFYGELNGFAEGEAIKKISADEGTLVHETAEKVLVGENPEVNESIAPAIQALKVFLKNTNIYVDLEWVEKRIVNFNERYAGTIDALALIDGKFGVLDIKTSQAIYRDYNLQTAAYFASLQENFRNLQTRWILRIDQNQNCLRCGAIRRVKGGREKVRKPRTNNGNGTYNFCRDLEHDWSELKGEIELKEFPYWHDDFQAFLGAKKLWEWENDYLLRKIGYV